jgi:hypothetical protein
MSISTGFGIFVIQFGTSHGRCRLSLGQGSGKGVEKALYSQFRDILAAGII